MEEVSRHWCYRTDEAGDLTNRCKVLEDSLQAITYLDDKQLFNTDGQTNIAQKGLSVGCCNLHRSSMYSPDCLQCEIDRLRSDLGEVIKDRNSWKHSFDSQADELKRLSDEHKDLIDAVECLAEIARAQMAGRSL